MSERYQEYNSFINSIDVKWDGIPDSKKENQIKDLARDYVKKAISNWISEAELKVLLEKIRILLQRQDIEKLNLQESLKGQIRIETRERLDKEMLINEAKTVIYESLWINNNLRKNSPIENFLKWITDELVIWNYELAIEIINTNGKVLLDSLKHIASWEWIKSIAKSLWKNVWDLFTWDAYERWKSVAQLWLITTWVSAWFVIWKKGLKLWIKQLTKLRPHKENIITSTEIKWVMKETWRKVEELLPKNELKIAETARKIEIERQIKWLEQLWLPKSFSRDMLESWMINEKFMWWDLLNRFEALKKKWIDINKMVDDAIRQVPNLTREEALLIFSYTDNTIFGKLNGFMRWKEEILKSLSPKEKGVTKRLIRKLERALEKMPDMEWELIYRWDSWKWWKWKIWDDIDLNAFTSVANSKQDVLISEKKNILVIIEGKKWRIKDITQLALIPKFWEHFPQIPRTSNEWVILPRSKVIIIGNDKAIYKWIEITEFRVKQTK